MDISINIDPAVGITAIVAVVIFVAVHYGLRAYQNWLLHEQRDWFNSGIRNDRELVEDVYPNENDR